MPFVADEEPVSQGFVADEEPVSPSDIPDRTTGDKLESYALNQLLTAGNPITSMFVQTPELGGGRASETARAQEALKHNANVLRVVAPMATLPLAAPASVLGLTVAGLGGMAGETVAQEAEKLGGVRPEMSPAEVLGAGVRNAIPFVSSGNPILRPIANAAIQGLGATAADLISGHGANPASSLIAAGGGAAGTLFQPVLSRGIRGVGATAEALQAGQDFIPALKTGAAQAFRPIEQHPLQTQALQARREIADMTRAPGQEAVDVPIAISEAINSPRLTSQMRIPGAELTEDQLKGLSDTAMHFAVRTQRSNRNANEVARQVWDVLGAKRDEFNLATQKAIEDFSLKATRAANDYDARAEAQFSALYPGGRSRAGIGNDIATLVDLTHQDAKKVWDDAYDAAKNLTAPDGTTYYSKVTIPADAIRDEATSLGMDFARNSEGGISIIAAPPGARSAVSAGQGVSGNQFAPDILNLDQARSIASELSRNIRNAGVLPGVDTRLRAQLLSKVQDEIQNAVGAFPPLRDALGDANKIYRENIGRFRNSFTKGIMNDVGEKGGLLPEAIVSRLTGPDSESYLKSLEETVGGPMTTGTTVGTDMTSYAHDLVREAFLSDARAAGTKIGTVDLGDAFDKIRKIPSPVRNKLFPNFSAMEDAAKTDKTFSEVSKSLNDPKKLVEVPMGDLQAALGSKDAGDLMSLAKTSLATSEANAAELSRLSLKDLAQRDQFDVYKYITDDRNSSRVSAAMGFIDKSNPQLGKDVRALYLDNLIESASGKGKTDPAVIAESLGMPSPKSITGQGTLGGAARETTEAVLGKPATDDLRKIAGLLSSLPKPENISMNEQRGFWHWLILGNEGTSIASKTGKFGLLARLTSLAPALRYRLASIVLTDQPLRRAAMQATGDGYRDVVNQGLGILTQNVARDFGWRSPQVQQLEQTRKQFFAPQ